MRRCIAGAVLAAACAAAHAQFASRAEPVPPPPPAAVPAQLSDDALPDGVPARGRRDIDAAWLAVPTDRYAHGVLGDAIEAAELRARLRDGRTVAFRLPENAVFEDLRPRLADLDGDGADEVIVVVSRQGAGAALAAFGVRGGQLALLAETPPIGTHHRWLNPVGAADVDGDGRPDVVIVQTPHLGGPLVAYRFLGGRFVEIARLPSFSNHAIGSRVLGLGALLDADGDGVADAVLPSADRRALRVIGFRGGTARELGTVPLPAQASGDFVVEARGVVVPMADGRALRVSFDARYTATTPSADGIGRVYMGREIARVMSFHGAAWLERSERLREERPDRLLTELALTPGMTVADIGAGTGYHSRRMARLVSPGNVYAVDIQPEMLKQLAALASADGITNIRPVLATPTDPKLPAASIDLAIMVDVYHELESPYEMLERLVPALKPGGRLVLVEFKGEDEGVPIRRLHKMTEAQVRREMSAHPLDFERTIATLPWQHAVVFRKR